MCKTLLPVTSCKRGQSEVGSRVCKTLLPVTPCKRGQSEVVLRPRFSDKIGHSEVGSSV